MSVVKYIILWIKDTYTGPYTDNMSYKIGAKSKKNMTANSEKHKHHNKHVKLTFNPKCRFFTWRVQQGRTYRTPHELMRCHKTVSVQYSFS